MEEERLNEEGLAGLVRMFQAVSLDPDPVSSTRLFVQTIREYYGNMGLLTIGTRNAPRGRYRLTRLLHQPGVTGEDLKDLDYLAADAPLHSGGFIGDVMQTDRSRRLDVVSVDNDPVLGR